MKWANWTGDQESVPTSIERPRSVEELSSVVKKFTGRTVRAVGSGHSFGDLVPTRGVIVSLDEISGLISVDHTAGLVKVAAGTKLHKLNELLAAEGLAMRNMGDIDRQSLAGAMSTATHGTGGKLGNLPTQIDSLEMVLADGSQLSIDNSDPDALRAARVSIGSLGIVTAYTLRVVPAFRLRCEHRTASLQETLAGIDEAVAVNEHFEFFTFPHSDQAWTKTTNTTDEQAGKRSAVAKYINDTVVENWLLDLLSRTGRAMPSQIPRLNRLISGLGSDSDRVDASHRIFPSNRNVRFTETEWAVPREACADALTDMRRMVDKRGIAVNFPFEVRFVAADQDSLLSPSYGRETAYIAAHMYRGMEWEPFFSAVQEIAVAHDGRPHWGKRHGMTAEDLASAYPEWDVFQNVRAKLDPEGLFTNDHVRRVLGPVRAMSS